MVGVLALALLAASEAASPSVYPSPDSYPDSSLDDDWYPEYTYGDAQQQALQAVECTEVTCKAKWRADGECDRMCNTPACEWDSGDCFHDDDGCYTHPTAADYRGNVSHGKNGVPCQYWDSQWPNTHTYTTGAYPDSQLGGHNSCRNPDPTDGSTGPWCAGAAHTRAPAHAAARVSPRALVRERRLRRSRGGAFCGDPAHAHGCRQVHARLVRPRVGLLRRRPAVEGAVRAPAPARGAQPH